MLHRKTTKGNKYKNNNLHCNKILFFKTILPQISFKGEKSKFPSKYEMQSTVCLNSIYTQLFWGRSVRDRVRPTHQTCSSKGPGLSWGGGGAWPLEGPLLDSKPRVWNNPAGRPGTPGCWNPEPLLGSIGRSLTSPAPHLPRGWGLGRPRWPGYHSPFSASDGPASVGPVQPRTRRGLRSSPGSRPLNPLPPPRGNTG